MAGSAPVSTGAASSSSGLGGLSSVAGSLGCNVSVLWADFLVCCNAGYHPQNPS